MADQTSNIPENILKAAKIILLVDWPDAGVARALVNAGFTVYSYSPDYYAEAKKNGEGRLDFYKIDNKPAFVDIVNIFRPEAEIDGIFEKHVLPLHAKTVWMQPPLNSAAGKKLAAENHLQFVEGVAIADIADKI
jgi:predicted CoA-binding protein